MTYRAKSDFLHVMIERGYLADCTDLQALDAVWQESEVLFGPDPNAGCPVTRDLLARMDNPISPGPAAAAE